jgi:hypothetical protein
MKQQHKELFNVGGDKLAIIDKVLKREKKRLELDAAPPARIKYSYIRTQNDLAERRKDYLETRFYENTMNNVNKFTILGDETRMRNELLLGFAVNSRDATVCFILQCICMPSAIAVYCRVLLW